MTNKYGIWIIVAVLSLVVIGIFIEKSYDIFSVIPNLNNFNPSFETNTNWNTFNFGASSSKGEYNTSWATNGVRSYHIKTGTYNFCLYQTLNLNNIDSVSFDIKQVSSSLSLGIISGSGCSGWNYGYMTINNSKAIINFSSPKSFQDIGILISTNSEVFLDNMILTLPGSICTPNCSCASNTCIGQTCSDGCTSTCSGTQTCTVGSGFCTDKYINSQNEIVLEKYECPNNLNYNPAIRISQNIYSFNNFNNGCCSFKFEISGNKGILTNDYYVSRGLCDEPRDISNLTDFFQCGTCRTSADTNCDGIVSRDELGIYINKWIANQISRDELGIAIQAWMI